MSTDTEKEGVVIDVTPEAAEVETETPETTETPQPATKKTASNPIALIIAIIALLAVGIVLFMAYNYTQQAAQELATTNSRLEQAVLAQQNLQTQIAENTKATQQQQTQLNEQQQHTQQQTEILALAKERFAHQEDLLSNERERMQMREVELRASVADVHRRVGSSSTQWIVAEAAYLLRIANHRLNLARDTETARSALKLADERLHDTQDPGWDKVRQQIAHDLQTLEELRLPDSAGISAKLAAIVNQIPQLKLLNATIGAQPPSEKRPPQERNERTWNTLLDDLWTGFKSTVRVHRNDQPVQAMLPPEQQFFLYENLRLHLEAARLAVARTDQALYRDNLNQSIQMVKSYFDSQDASTEAMLKTLNSLQALTIRPPLPDISESLRSLQTRQQLNTQLQQTLPGTTE